MVLLNTSMLLLLASILEQKVEASTTAGILVIAFSIKVLVNMRLVQSACKEVKHDIY